MKTLKTSLFAAALATLAFTSCKKAKETVDEVQNTVDAAVNQAISDNLVQDANDIFMSAARDRNLLGARTSDDQTALDQVQLCASITVSGNFPAKNILIDFGTGCITNGILRSGSINVVLTDSVNKPGAKATLTFNNYKVNGFQKEGIIEWTNISTATTRSWNRKVTNGKITNPAGKYWLHTSDMIITQTAGVSTPLMQNDDVFTLSGTKTVTNPNNATRNITTQTPLQKKNNCDNIDQGILKVQGPNHYALIDFGSGTCDNQATVSIDGRPPVTVTLR
jgi:hypothetical protein